jgi:hypothetical protein
MKRDTIDSRRSTMSHPSNFMFVNRTEKSQRLFARRRFFVILMYISVFVGSIAWASSSRLTGGISHTVSFAGLLLIVIAAIFWLGTATMLGPLAPQNDNQLSESEREQQKHKSRTTYIILGVYYALIAAFFASWQPNMSLMGVLHAGINSASAYIPGLEIMVVAVILTLPTTVLAWMKR